MVPIPNPSVQKSNICEEASNKEEVFALHLHYSKQTAISSRLFVPRPFAWCLFTPHVMAIRLIY